MHAQPLLTVETIVAIIAFIEAKVALMVFSHLDCVEVLTTSEQNSDLTDSMRIHRSAWWI